MREHLASVEPALLFLVKVTSSPQERHKLARARHPNDLIKLAAEDGYDVTRDTLWDAMKILVDRKLEKDGIPSWVRTRLAPI